MGALGHQAWVSLLLLACGSQASAPGEGMGGGHGAGQGGAVVATGGSTSGGKSAARGGSAGAGGAGGGGALATGGVAAQGGDEMTGGATTGGATTGGGSPNAGGGGEPAAGDGGEPGATCSSAFIQEQRVALVAGWTPPSSTCVAPASGGLITNYTAASISWQSVRAADCEANEGFHTQFDWLLLEVGTTASGRPAARGQFRETRDCSVQFTLAAASCQCDVVAGPETYLGSYTSFLAELVSSVTNGQLSFSSPSVSFSSRFPSNESSSVVCTGTLLDKNGDDMCEGSGASATWLHQTSVGACHTTLNHNFFDLLSPAWYAYIATQQPIACPVE